MNGLLQLFWALVRIFAYAATTFLFFAEFGCVCSSFSLPLARVRRVVLLPEISYFRWKPYPCNFYSSESPSKSRIYRIRSWTWASVLLSDQAMIASYCRKGDMHNHEVYHFSAGNPSPLLPNNDRNNYSWFCAAGFHQAVSGSKSFSKLRGWHKSCCPRFHTFSPVSYTHLTLPTIYSV